MRTVDPARHAARRAAIQDAAARVFAERGYDGATTAEICRAAGIGSGTLFHYFGDKRSILVSVFSDDHAANDTLLAGLDPDRPLDEVWRVLTHLTRDVTDPLAPGIVVAMLQLAVRDAPFADLLEDGDARVRAGLARLLGRAVEAGEVRADLDPARAARWLVALVDTLYLMCGDPGVDPATEREEAGVVAARYLGVETRQVSTRPFETPCSL